MAVKITAGAWFLRAILGISTVIAIVLAGMVWVSGVHDTEQSMTNGLRLLITLETGDISGTQAPPESDLKPADAAEKPAESKTTSKESPAAEKPAESPDIPSDVKKDDTEASSKGSPTADVKSAPVSIPFPGPATSSIEIPKTTADSLAAVKENLMEKASDGMIPVIAKDGTKPWKYYGRPYTHKGHLPMIAIVIGGLGQNKSATDMAIKLPNNFSLSFTPYAKELSVWLNAARITGHEVLLDLPVEPSNYPATDPGPYGLLVGKGNEVNASRLEWLMSRGQGYIGFLTPQNDVYTANSDAFKMLLGNLAQHGLVLLMGHEPAKSETYDMLNTAKTANSIGDILIDEELSTSSIQTRLLALEKLATKRGYAVGVAQPFPITVQQLNVWSAQLEKDGYELAPISYIIGMKFPQLTMAHYNHLPYRQGVGIMLLNNDNCVFAAKRIDMIAEAWQMPQGGIDPGETPLQAAWRELLEETGTDKAMLLYESPKVFYYDLPEDLVPVIWKGQFRGQQQNWFVMRFTGVDSDINIATEHPEFSEWKWVEFESLPDLIVPFKRDLYQKLVDEFRDILKNNF